MYDFLVDLDEYFCEKYANYDKLCVLPGYRMPTMQATSTDEFGRSYSYTLPANTMRLALQENKAEILAELKKRIVDKGFSFSFRPLGLFKRMRYKGKKGGYKYLKEAFRRYNVSLEETQKELDIEPEIWQNICKGKFAPTKNTIFSLALVAHFSIEDTVAILNGNGYEVDSSAARDVVIGYLLEKKVFSRPMMEAAFAEYKVSNLYIK